jgi:hypothetical protein
MINYVILDKTTGIVDFCIQWGDGRVIASDYPLEANQEILAVDDTKVTVISGDVYNFTTEIFSATTVVPVVEKNRRREITR